MLTYADVCSRRVPTERRIIKALRDALLDPHHPAAVPGVRVKLYATSARVEEEAQTETEVRAKAVLRHYQGPTEALLRLF
jgi:hypothetical protein